jgi:hypothetical protein
MARASSAAFSTFSFAYSRLALEGRAHVDRDGADVGSGQEARPAEREVQHERRDEAQHRDRPHPLAVVQRPGDDVAVAVGLVVEPYVELWSALLRPFFSWCA